ncbi:uncharacterized protein LOC124887801 [Capsicum annuum]|uniref:uncharacterized protein LOC124887801 n=1 Tax=Capsicum annuum TaxID=4072 RepID=UPI001FB05681|nr:uncharacterized protein LOC124887801 [Capsicum annuum]
MAKRDLNDLVNPNDGHVLAPIISAVPAQPAARPVHEVAIPLTNHTTVSPTITDDDSKDKKKKGVKGKTASDEIQVEKKTLPLPFPQRQRKHQEEASYKKFLDLLRQVHVNFSLIYILQSVPKYAKYLKDIMEKKIRLIEYATVALTEECTSKIQNKLPTKLKDLGSFTLQIIIGQTISARGLCDLGASINLMPTSWY